MLKQFLINIGRLESDNISNDPEPLPTVEAQSNKTTHVVLLKNTVEAEPIKREQPENWSDQIKELENYFSNTSIPTKPIRLDGCSTITDAKLFIESHIATVRANNGNKTFLPYLNRLQAFKTKLMYYP